MFFHEIGIDICILEFVTWEQLTVTLCWTYLEIGISYIISQLIIFQQSYGFPFSLRRIQSSFIEHKDPTSFI